MMTPEVEEFLRTLILQVRDTTIVECDGRLAVEAASPSAYEWKGFLKDSLSETAIKTIIAEVVDRTLYNLMRAIDDESLPLIFCASSGENINLRSATWSELAVQYLGDDGMLAKYSEQRLSRYGKG